MPAEGSQIPERYRLLERRLGAKMIQPQALSQREVAPSLTLFPRQPLAMLIVPEKAGGLV